VLQNCYNLNITSSIIRLLVGHPHVGPINICTKGRLQ